MVRQRSEAGHGRAGEAVHEAELGREVMKWLMVGAGDAGSDGVPARSALDDENDAIEWERLFEEEVERKRYMWIASLETIEISCNLFRVEKAVGDGNCLFYSLLRNNSAYLARQQ